MPAALVTARLSRLFSPLRAACWLQMERGNVAQLGQLEHMQEIATALEFRAHELLAAMPPKGPAFHADVVEAFEVKHYDFSVRCTAHRKALFYTHGLCEF